MEKVRRTKLERQSQQVSTHMECTEEHPSVVSSTGLGITDVVSTSSAEHEHGNCYSKKYVGSSTSNDHVMMEGTVAKSHPGMGVDEHSKGGDLSNSEQFTEVSDEFCNEKDSCQRVLKPGCRKEANEIAMVHNKHTIMYQPIGLSSDDGSLSSPDQGSVWMEQREPSKVDLGALSRDELPSDPHMYRRLSEEECMLLSRLSCAYEDTMLSNLRSGGSSVKLDSSSYSIGDSLSDYEAVVQHAVEFAKRLEDFQRLDFDDRIACFKTSVDTLVAVYNSYVFVVERNSWLMIKGEVSVDLLMSVFPDYPFTQWRTTQCRELKSLAKNDVTVYCLLHCILLFNPSGEKISDRLLVSSLRDKYMILLRHYLEATFSFIYSEDYFKELQKKVVEIQDIGHADRKHAADTNCHLAEEFVPFELLQELHKEDS